MNDEKTYALLLRTLSNLLQDERIYPEHHPEIERQLKTLLECLEDFFKKESEAGFMIVDEEIVINNRPCIELSKSLSSLIALFLEKKFSKLSFIKGVTGPELFRFVKLLNSQDAFPKEGNTWYDLLARNHITNIRCQNLSMGVEKREDREVKIPLFSETMLEPDGIRIQELEKFLEESEKLDYDYLMSMLSHLTPQVLHHYKDLLFLGSLKAYNQNTFNHVLNVAVLSCMIAAAIGLPEEMLDKISVAGFLHDIGKDAIPLEVLNKPGKLSAEERAVIEKHPQYGAKTILFGETLNEIALIAAFEHHMNFDGTGYPSVFRKRQANLISRIVAIADVYDALRGTRIYTGEMSPEEVYALMQDSKGKKFDPHLLDVFFQCIGVYPPAIHVELDTGEKAVVVRPNPEDIFRPDVMLMESGEKGKVISLMEKENGMYIRSITKSLPPVYQKKK